jgi:hypothetical protein
MCLEAHKGYLSGTPIFCFEKFAIRKLQRWLTGLKIVFEFSFIERRRDVLNADAC